MYLVSLDPLASGGPKVGWNQLIHGSALQLGIGPIRRTSSLSPSFSEGIVVCPTDSGAVVAVDLPTRSIMWSHGYVGQQLDPRMLQRRVVVRNGRRVIVTVNAGMLDGNGSWMDSNAIIALGRVFVTPRDSDQLFCIDLLTGERVWTNAVARGDGLFLAAVTDTHAIVVGRKSVRAYLLDTGDVDWMTVIDNPVGRGFRTGNHYFLPTSSGEVLKLHVQTGAIEARSQSTDGLTPGNLVGAGGVVLSQNGTDLIAYRTREVMEALARTLKDQPDNPPALIARGELAKADGRLADALKDFQRAYSITKAERTRQLLVRAYFAGLQRDFKGFSERTEEFRSAILSDAEAFEFYRHLAAGFTVSKRKPEAFLAYLQLAEYATEANVVEMVSSTDEHEKPGEVRMDRWIAGRLQQLYLGVPADQQRDMDATLRKRVERLVAANDIDKLGCALRILQPLRSPLLHRAIAERLDADTQPILLEQQLLLLEGILAARTDLEPKERKSHESLILARRVELAALAMEVQPYVDSVRRLHGEFAETVVWKGLTGRQLLDRLGVDAPPNVSPVQHRWPNNVVHVEEADVNGNIFPTQIMDFDGSRGPVFRDSALKYTGNDMRAVDEFGRVLWKFRGTYRDDVFSISSRHHLLLIKTPNQIHALNLIDARKQGTPKIQWHIDLDPLAEQRFVRREVPDERHRLAITASNVFYLVRDTLIAVDPVTGSRLWQRPIDITGRAYLCADEDNVVVIDQGTDQRNAAVYRAVDGSFVKKSRMSERPELRMVGTKALYANSLQLVDQISFETVWKADFDPTAAVTLIDDDHCAVLETSGRFAVVRLRDGKTVRETEIGPVPHLKRIFVRRSQGRLVLIVDQGVRVSGDGPKIARALFESDGEHSGYDRPVIYGTVMGLDENTGQVAWRTEVHGQVLTPSIAAGSPFLVFAGEVNSVEPNLRGNPHRSLSVLCLDTRDGYVLYQQVDDSLASGGKPSSVVFHVQADPIANEITLSLSGKQIRFRFNSSEDSTPQIK
ncbi:MAG: PQQ-binding-like beta-propeller repeat protein [Planctomycetota bacterium]|nr:PQQ-binding-like beta-propeller repeat protein [Planctomycetota bacterium]